MPIRPSPCRLVQVYFKNSRRYSCFVGALVFIGWIMNIAIFKSVFSGLATMKANTAIAFILSGLSLLLLTGSDISQRTLRIAQSLASAVGLIALLTLCEYLLAGLLALTSFCSKTRLQASLQPGEWLL